MKTYPILKENGALRGFEIINSWMSCRTLNKILKSVQGVKDIKSRGGLSSSEDRLTFLFHEEEFVVFEPFGDSSRYWIGPKNPDLSAVDITPLHQAFQNYRSPMARILSWIRNKSG